MKIKNFTKSEKRYAFKDLKSGETFLWESILGETLAIKIQETPNPINAVTLILGMPMFMEKDTYVFKVDINI